MAYIVSIGAYGSYWAISLSQDDMPLEKLIQKAGNRLAVVMVPFKDQDEPLHALAGRLAPDELASVYVIVPKSAIPSNAADADLRLHVLTSDELTVAQGCLCCSFRSELNMFLGKLFMALLARQEPRVKAVLVLTRSSDPALLQESLIHAPFLAQRFAFAGVLEL